jgi:hypothetical protein
MVPALARACPDHTIVVRPHPSERQQTWRDATAGCPNVRVVYEGSAVPWLIACEVVIHNGCTTAVESYLLDEPAIAYQPTTSESFDLRLPNLLSHRAFDRERLLELTSAQLRGGIPRDPTEEEKKEGLIDEYVASRRGPFAGERIVDALENFATSEAPDGPLPFAPYALARTAAALRSGIRRCEAHIPGHHNNAKYLRHMFPGATLADVEARVASFGSLLGRFSGVKARQLFANVFEIAV